MKQLRRGEHGAERVARDWRGGAKVVAVTQPEPRRGKFLARVLRCARAVAIAGCDCSDWCASVLREYTNVPVDNSHFTHPDLHIYRELLRTALERTKEMRMRADIDDQLMRSTDTRVDL